MTNKRKLIIGFLSSFIIFVAIFSVHAQSASDLSDLANTANSLANTTNDLANIQNFPKNILTAMPLLFTMIMASVFSMFFLTIAIALYIYMSLAFMAIAKKTSTEPAWLAWIPIANFYLMSKIAEMSWWPILLIIGLVIPIVNVLAAIILAVFYYIWLWKIFERVGRPGWWGLLNLIPFAGGIAFLVLLGVAAWSKDKNFSVSSPTDYQASGSPKQM